MTDAIRHLLILFGILFVHLDHRRGLIWLERRLLAPLGQVRAEPRGPLRHPQVLADMIKVFTKEDWIPPFADKAVFIIAPAVIVVVVLMSFTVIPYAPGIEVVDLNIGLLFFLAMSSLGVYSVALAGWASDSKYSLLGGLRASAQMLSYEARVVLRCRSRRLLQRANSGRATSGLYYGSQWFVVFLSPLPRRTACLDLPEAESELVAGYHSEYSGLKFGMFFVGEYLGIMLISAITVALFFGGWLGPVLPPLAWFLIKTLLFICFFILLRASLPRPRYDQLMSFGWKVMLPLSLLNLLVTGAVVLMKTKQ
jgi:NADH-quinone oxidoreductase subunit H